MSFWATWYQGIYLMVLYHFRAKNSKKYFGPSNVWRMLQLDIIQGNVMFDYCWDGLATVKQCCSIACSHNNSLWSIFLKSAFFSPSVGFMGNCVRILGTLETKILENSDLAYFATNISIVFLDWIRCLPITVRFWDFHINCPYHTSNWCCSC